MSARLKEKKRLVCSFTSTKVAVLLSKGNIPNVANLLIEIPHTPAVSLSVKVVISTCAEK